MPKVKVKTGCGTCKKRKLKCGEERPACTRCRVGGRTCDGYGIWDYPTRDDLLRSYSRREISTVQTQQPRAVSLLLSCSIEEREYVDWFLCRTVVKLPGTFISPFWSTLLLQAGSCEPAVFHSILALVSIHKEGTIASESDQSSPALGTQQNHFSLRHYVLALDHLKSYFSATERRSVRVILITCLSFICLDLLQAHFESAQMHLEKGFGILNKTDILRAESAGEEFTNSQRELIDDWIVEAFSRLRFMGSLFGNQPSSNYGCMDAPRPTAWTYLSKISSFRDAWQQLQRLFDKIFCLANRSQLGARIRDHSASFPSSAQSELQNDVLLELDLWLSGLQVYINTRCGCMSTGEEKAWYLLRAYYHMAVIMTHVSIHPDDEMAFDTHNDNFILLLGQLSMLSSIEPSHSFATNLFDHTVRMDRSITDLGWIAPLYYTAIKCRLHSVRVQALRLLESSLHREGIWDARVMGCVAQKVVQLEEQDFYTTMPSTGGIDFVSRNSDWPTVNQPPNLPRLKRFNNVEVSLLGSPLDKIHLTLTRRTIGTSSSAWTLTYSIKSRQWDYSLG